MLFSESGLKKGLIRSLEARGYTEATPIQEEVLKIAMDGHNIVWQSQTGTGKTAAFLLPVLNQIDTNDKSLQALIIAPTRELVNQIGDEIKSLTSFYGVSYVCLYGGASPNVQKKNLNKKPAIIVATPWRLMDFMNQEVVNIHSVKYFILDEVDRMLDMGFVRDIRRIRDRMPNLKQAFTFSATMNDAMKTIIKEHVDRYEFIKIGEEVTVDAINHTIMHVAHENKLHNVIKLIREHEGEKIIIFTHTKRNTKTIRGILDDAGFNVGMLNGNMSQGKRQGELNDFKLGKIQILVTTDVAARWLNMDKVVLVINFDVPVDAKSYIHRIGRTGRAGEHGKAIMLVAPLEKPLLQEIEKIHDIRIKETDHSMEKDRAKVYSKVKLNKSTDKPWGKRYGKNPQSKKKPTRRSGGWKKKSADEKFTFKPERKYKENKWSFRRDRQRAERENRKDQKPRSERKAEWHSTARKPERQEKRNGRNTVPRGRNSSNERRRATWRTRDNSRRSGGGNSSRNGPQRRGNNERNGRKTNNRRR